VKEAREDEKELKKERKEKKRKKKEDPSLPGEELGSSAMLDTKVNVAAQPPVTEDPPKIDPEKEKASFYILRGLLGNNRDCPFCRHYRRKNPNRSQSLS
jgi:hypothetical protein